MTPVTPVTPTSQASRARGGVAVGEAGGEGEVAEAAGHLQLRRGPGAERGENISAEHWLFLPATTRHQHGEEIDI